MCSTVDDYNNRNLFLTAKLFKQGYRYHKIQKAFSIFYHSLLQQGISEPIVYGDLVYKFKRIIGKPNFSDQFKKIIKVNVIKKLDITWMSCDSLHAWL